MFLRSKYRYASWGTDRTFRWLWMAALADAIFAFKNRYKVDKEIDRGITIRSETYEQSQTSMADA